MKNLELFIFWGGGGGGGGGLFYSFIILDRTV